MFSAVLLVAIVALGVFSSRRVSARIHQFRLIAILLPALSLLLAVSWICQVLGAPASNWNQARLAPLFAWRHGFDIYSQLSSGAILDAVYGPLSYAAYFPSLLAHSPTPAVLIAAAMASLYYFLPVAWIFTSGQFRGRESRPAGLFLLVIFGLWTMGSASLHYSCFSVHADAPSLGFGAVACGMLIQENGSRRPVRSLVLSAVFTVLAMFSKQSMIFLVPILLLFIWVTDGMRRALQFAAAVAVLSAITFGLLSTVFSAKAMYFDLFAFPSHDGFGGGYLLLAEGTLHSTLDALRSAALRLWSYSRWPILGIAVCYIIEIHIRRFRKIAAREWLRENRWALFHFVALGGLPFSLYFGSKVGGDVNSFSLHLYFSLVGFLLFLGHLVLRHENIARPAAAVCVMIAITLIPEAAETLAIPKLISQLWVNDTEQVFEYSTKHPGETYFSFFPLPVLMAEGQLYHFEYGLFHRQLGHVPLSQAHFLRYIPSHPRYVQREWRRSPVAGYLPQFACETTQPGIADLHFYSECTAPNGPQ